MQLYIDKAIKELCDDRDFEIIENGNLQFTTDAILNYCDGSGKDIRKLCGAIIFDNDKELACKVIIEAVEYNGYKMVKCVYITKYIYNHSWKELSTVAYKEMESICK